MSARKPLAFVGFSLIGTGLLLLAYVLYVVPNLGDGVGDLPIEQQAAARDAVLYAGFNRDHPLEKVLDRYPRIVSLERDPACIQPNLASSGFRARVQFRSFIGTPGRTAEVCRDVRWVAGQ